MEGEKIERGAPHIGLKNKKYIYIYIYIYIY